MASNEVKKEFEGKTECLTITNVEILDTPDGKKLEKAYFETVEFGSISCKLVRIVTEERKINGIVHKRKYKVNLGFTEVPPIIERIALELPCKVENFRFTEWLKDDKLYRFVKTIKHLEDIKIVGKIKPKCELPAKNPIGIPDVIP